MKAAKLWNVEKIDSFDRTVRFLTMFHGGGVVATMAFLGTVASSEAGISPSEFYATLAFILGLAALLGIGAVRCI